MLERFLDAGAITNEEYLALDAREYGEPYIDNEYKEEEEAWTTTSSNLTTSI